MIDFTIMEYNFETKKYTVIGLSEGMDSQQAKKKFIEKTGWEATESTMLFAKQPLCR